MRNYVQKVHFISVFSKAKSVLCQTRLAPDVLYLAQTAYSPYSDFLAIQTSSEPE